MKKKNHKKILSGFTTEQKARHMVFILRIHEFLMRVNQKKICVVITSHRISTTATDVTYDLKITYIKLNCMHARQ